METKVETNGGAAVSSSDLLAARSAIDTAKRLAEKGDIQTGLYALRDLRITEAAGLKDLAWAGHRQGDLTSDELAWLICELETFIAANDKLSESARKNQKL